MPIEITHLLPTFAALPAFAQFAPFAPFAPFAQGFGLSFGLIVAIGAQNAFVLRQGLRGAHIASVVLFCALSDALLIASGVWGMAQAIGEHRVVTQVLTWLGVAFLSVYGWRALQRARQPHSLNADGHPVDGHPVNGQITKTANAPGSRIAVLAQAAAFTLLNPHVHLDTVLLMGSIGAQQPVALQPVFVAGASAASLLWFTLLGFGARVLAPWFARPAAWRWLDTAIGITMWLLAATLALRS